MTTIALVNNKGSIGTTVMIHEQGKRQATRPGSSNVVDPGAIVDSAIPRGCFQYHHSHLVSAARLCFD